jgi:hypothetical protein
VSTGVYPINDVAWATPVVNTWYHIALIRGWGGNANSWTVCINGTSLGATSLTTTYPDIAAALQIGQGATGTFSTYPPAYNDTYVKATTYYSVNQHAYLTADPTNILTGTENSHEWLSANLSVTEQRFHIDLGTATVVPRIYYENGHNSGTITDEGAKNFTFWGSNTAASFAELTYGTDTGWTQLTTSQGTFDQHVAADQADPKYITVTNTTAYQYYAFKFADNWGNASYMGVRRIELNPVTNVAFNGWIDEFRISKGIARWTANFIPLSRPYATASNTFLIGFTRPLQGVKLYVANANTETSTLAVSEWNGSSWTTLTVTDNTSPGVVTLAQTGTVTWASTAGTSKPRYINGLSLYWYQFTISTGNATIYYVTVDAPMQEIRNVWDGRESFVTKCTLYTGTEFKDYTDSVNDQAPSTVLDLSALSTSGYVLIGFTEPMQALHFTIAAGSENSTGSTAMSVKYGDGRGGWVDVVALTDGTATTTTSISKNGVSAWQSPGPGIEFAQTIGDDSPLFYYKVSFAAALDANTKVGEIRGISAPLPLGTYRFSETYQNRLFLFNEFNGAKNKAIYSMENAPDIFNGTDTGTLYFGDDTEIIAVANVYNVFGNSAYDQLIVGKKNEIYRLSGDSPETWTVKRISLTVGCVAPLSMVSTAITGEGGNAKQIVIWQGDNGFYMTDGSAVVPISDDIKCYFDANDSRYIPTARRTKTVAWYDPSVPAYKVLISSGSSATAHNLELEYSLTAKEWTKIKRIDAAGADPLQCGFRVFDTNGIGYTYGGNAKGFMYRLENGYTFAGTGIEEILHTKDMILDPQVPLFRKSTIKFMRTALKKKTNGGSIAITHYGDQVLTVSGLSGQLVPSAITVETAPYNTQSCAMGPFLYHSLKFTISASSVSDGMELVGLGLYVEPYTILR